jgi:hypothetical protein
MRERVTTYAGSFNAGPRPGGGFMVTATLPFQRGGEPVVTETGGERADVGGVERG